MNCALSGMPRKVNRWIIQNWIVSGDGTTITIAGAVTSSTTGSSGYDVAFAYPRAPPSATVLQLVCFARATTFASNFAGSTGHCGGNPTSAATYSLYLNAVSIGIFVISTSGTFAFSTSGGSVLFSIGDTLSVLTPMTDATLSNVTVTVHGTYP